MKLRSILTALTGLIVVSALCVCCSVRYSFNGASINYDELKTVQIADFPIHAAYVWAPMRNIFNDELKDIFTKRTKLQQVRRNGDMIIEGEITQYQQRNKNVTSEGYSMQTELSMTVNVRFTNNVHHEQDFERTFNATSFYDSSQSLNSVQEQLVTEMVKNIVKQIFNATVANW